MNQKLFAFGDQYVYGFIEPEKPFTDTNKRYKKNYVNTLCNFLNIDYTNFASTFQTNQKQLHILYEKLFDNTIKNNDIVFFGIQSCLRSPFFTDYDPEYPLQENWIDLYINEYINTLIILNKLCNDFNVKLIAYNICEDPISKYNNEDRERTFKDNNPYQSYIEQIRPELFIPFTIIDIVIDNFDVNNQHMTHPILSKTLEPDEEKRKQQFLNVYDNKSDLYFQPNKNLNQNGHDKVSLFLIEYFQNNFKQCLC